MKRMITKKMRDSFGYMLWVDTVKLEHLSRCTTRAQKVRITILRRVVK